MAPTVTSLMDIPITAKSRKAKLIEQMQKEGIKLALNTDLKPIAKVPTYGYSPIVLIDSQDFKDLLIIVWAEMFDGKVIQGSDLAYLLCLIRAECRCGARILTEIESEKIEDDPLIQTVLELMGMMPKFDGPTKKLLDRLRVEDAALRKSGESIITPYVNGFSRALRRLTPVLMKCGVDVKIEHRESGSHTTLLKNSKFEAIPQAMLAGDGLVYVTDGKPCTKSSDASPDEPSDSDSVDDTDDTDAPRDSDSLELEA